MGQDILTTAHLAASDIRHRRSSEYFAWPTIIHVDNPVVQEVMERGLAENHSHLNGAAPMFHLSWLSLMNHPEDIKKYKDSKEFVYDLSPTSQYGTYNRLEWTERLQLACWIRTKLFLRLRGAVDELNLSDDVLTQFQVNRATFKSKLSRSVDSLRAVYGTRFPQSNGTYRCLDYAYPGHLGTGKNDGYYRLLVGERYLLYRCFRECFEEHFSQYEQDLFYLYLLLQLRFRSELIQVNQKIGFHNFLEYQNRKGTLWEHHSEYVAEGYRIAINGKMEDQCITSQEDRVMPKNTASDDLNKIYQIDKEISFAADMYNDNVHLNSALLQGQWSYKRLSKEAIHNKSFYTLHFAKDISKDRAVCGKYKPRNYIQRKNAREQALALAKALSNYSYLRYRIRGIDACSSEIGCRPETFATEYRFLRDFTLTGRNMMKSAEQDPVSPHLGATYHAGEDFLDIIDGLRAIDEAVIFLGLERGDRIGHAIALGIRAELYYKIKDYHLITTKQNHLDDLVWLICRSSEYNVSIPHDLLRSMQEKVYKLIEEIYGETDDDVKNISHREYFYGWKLRGDHPDMFTHVGTDRNFDYREKSKGYRELEKHGGYHSLSGQYLNYMSRKHTGVRQSQTLQKLLYYYHYDKKVRDVGNEEYEVRIDKRLEPVITAMQEAMIQELYNKGICVECNPSSNYLIGPLELYKDHPVFRFNQHRMALPHRNHMCVSINTDDMGVFDTSLENEYALIAAALEDQQRENGQNYNDDWIADYLEHLRTLGHRQTFKPLQEHKFRH